jgi:chaperonin GroES
VTTKIKSISPLYDGVLIRPLAEDSRTKGGLYIPDVHHGSTPYARGEIVECGMGRPTADGKIVDLQVKKGQVVLYSRTAGVRFPVDGEHLSLMPETAIFAVLEVEEESPIVTLVS